MELTNKDRRRKRTVDLSSMMWGMVPPQARELEEAILGGLMLDKSCFETVSTILKPECFYVDGHQRIFAAISRLHAQSKPVDILTVVEELKFKEELDVIGGPYYITKLTSNVVSTANIEYHSHIILEKYRQREVIRICGEKIGEAYEDSCSTNEMLDELSRDVSNLLESGATDQGITMPENCNSFLIKLDDRIQKDKKGHIQGITSGFKEVDEKTHGWQPEDLITLAALSSVGKSCMALNLARNAALDPVNPVPTAFFSREMSKPKLMARLVAMESEILLDSIHSGKIDERMYQQIISKGIKSLEKAPLFLIPAAGMSWQEVRREARKLKRKYGVGFVIDDYVQLAVDIDIKNKNREQQLATISRENKQTAQLLGISYMQLSQVDKTINKRANKEPQLEDLRESSAIGNDSDIVGFLYRPEYHEIFSDETGHSTKGKVYWKFAKFRDGERNIKIELRSNLAIQKFYSKDDPEADKKYHFDPSKKNEQFDEGIEENKYKF
jgi:replicative DNA helicase